MPPKPDEGEEKKKKPEPVIIEGVDILELTFSKLQELTLRLYEKLLNTREERISLQIERDKLRAFWEITRQEIDLCRSTCLIKDNELQEVETESYRILKEIDQEVKYIGYEHKQNVSNLHKSEAAMFSRVEEEMTTEEIQLLSEKKKLKEKLREVKFENEDQLRSVREQNLENLTEIKISTEQKLIEMQKEFINYLNKVKDQITLKHEMEMAEIEERKNLHITELKSIHKYHCEELKGYYNSVTKENLTVISTLKESIDKIKRKEEEMASEVKLIIHENENLKEPLTQTLAQVKELKRNLANYEKDLGCLYATERDIEKTTKTIKKLKSENESICLKIKELKETKSIIKLSESAKKDCETYEHISNIEEMIKLLNNDLKSKVQILSDEIKAVSENKSEIFNFLKKNYLTVENLQYELFVVCKAHDDLIRSYERKLEQFGVDNSKLGYKPLLLENLGLGPAGLVTKNL